MVKRLFPVVLAGVALAVALGVRGAFADPVGPYRAYLPQVATDSGGPAPTSVPIISPRAGIPMPNPALTPGDVLTRDVALICTVGYTATVRDVSDATKEQVYDSYGLFTHAPGAYEIDHLVSLELGGSNDVRNLWPEIYDDPNGARVKDVLENKMHDLVCAGSLDIVVAQQAIATDWYRAYLTYVSPTGAPTRTPTPVGVTTSAPTPRAPTAIPTTTPTGVRTGAVCNDGSASTATGSGACSGHGGVSYWLYG